jgi:hypothetical protein
MNVFEDLVIELKEQNLLEKTVIDLENQARADGDLPEETETAVGSTVRYTDKKKPTGQKRAAQTPDPVDPADEAELVVDGDAEQLLSAADENNSKIAAEKSQKEFFTKRAINEVSGLQMVEHVLTSVEREYMKVVPKPFDDLDAKMALHAFVNSRHTPDSQEYKTGEQALMQELESWCMALTERDRNVSVADLRRFCENSRPALSSQALLALARFYRNSPYTEGVRAKFDLVITRLFSRPAADERRVCLFTREETIKHLNTLYSEWSSVPLYSAEDNASNVLLTGLSFDDLAAEAEAAGNFDQLTASDFFGRVRLFKESISELFYAPSVTAAAIESNIRIGNTFVALIDRERRKLDGAGIETLDLDHQTVSDVTGRTLDLVELLRQREVDATAEEDNEPEIDAAPEPQRQTPVETEPPPPLWSENVSSVPARLMDSVRHVNRWLVISAVLIVFLCLGLYVWADFIAEEKIPDTGVTQVQMEGTPFGEFVKTGKISGDTFYGLLQPTWEAMPKEKRQELLQRLLEAGKEKGYKQVHLINKDGKAAGFASATRLEVNMP